MTRIHADVRSRLFLLFGLVLIAGYLLITIFQLARSSYDIAGVFLVGPALAVLSIPLLARARRTEPDPWVGQLFTFGLLAMVFAGFAHLFVDFSYYEGVADARVYSTQGAAWAAQLWQGEFAPHLDIPLIGTGFMYVLTGMIYALIGPTIVGGYLFYSWLAFWGLYFCYRAFRTAMPGADYRRYALLILFLPSLVFWSSGIGKGAWMTLCMGLALLGAARLLSSTTRWILPLLTGLGGTALVRPHITALLVVALLAGVLVRRTVNATLLSPIVHAATVGVLVIVGAVVLSHAASFLKLDTLSIESVTQVLNKTQQNTSDIGQSTFAAYAVNSPLNLPGALVTVLFRPFPWEATSLVILASSVEGSLLIAFIALSWRRWRQAPRLLRRYSYLMLALIAILLFVIAFSTLGNFGLLVRERVMIFPLVLVPLCLARRISTTTNDDAVEQVALR
ncbi:MAG: hypothetical protein ACRDS9_20720 [Pseudonocardiaceae bacterium]